MDVYFYTRPGCHLCEEAKRIMHLIREKVPFALHERNIEEQNDWTETYGLMIPVVEFEGTCIAYGKVDYLSVLTKLQVKLTNNLKK